MSKTPEEISDTRDYNKHALNAYASYLDSTAFEYAIQNLFQDLNNQLQKEIDEYFAYSENNSSEDGYYIDTRFLEEKLSAIAQMQVVYLYKDFEISIKTLIRAAYQIDTSNFYQWNKIADYLKLKNIRLSEIEGYEEIWELKEVNNAIKHSGTIKNKNTQNIIEFRQKQYVDHDDLNEFYRRVKNIPILFIDKLSSKIYDNLYIFDENRLDHIAELFALRMDKTTADNFIEKFKSKY